jgi:hypothetical protein
MSKKTQYIFIFLINYFGLDKLNKHASICIFGVPKIIDQTLTNNLRSSFNQYELKRNIIVSINDERSNLNTMIIVMKSIVDCEFD